MILSDVENGSKIIRLECARVPFEAELELPPDTCCAVVMAHGADSSRHSHRNRFVAQVLREHGIGTMLLDLPSADGAATGSPRILLAMAERIMVALAWLRENLPELAVGLYGAGTGAAAAFIALSEQHAVKAMVARGARMELVRGSLPQIATPTLLIVGSRDVETVRTNRDALGLLGATKKEVEIVPGATHAFDEPGALTAAGMKAATWFGRHLVRGPTRARYAYLEHSP